MRNALQLCLRSLTSGCRFNIVGFGSTHEALFPASRTYDQSSLDVATAHVAAMQADLGGTEMLPALQFAVQQPASEGLPRQIVILTDGEVTNTDALLALAREHADQARIFTFGIGAGASHHLVRGLARAGGGTSEFIYPGERIEPKVLRQVARLLSPALTDVRVEWVGGDVTQAPVKSAAGLRGWKAAGVWIRERRAAVEGSVERRGSVRRGVVRRCPFPMLPRDRRGRWRRSPLARGSVSSKKAANGSAPAARGRRTGRAAK